MSYFFTFLEGFASFISPCILPLVPMYISYFAGSEEKSTKKALINSIFFVLRFINYFYFNGYFRKLHRHFYFHLHKIYKNILWITSHNNWSFILRST